MHNFGTFFLWALAACTLLKGSLATSLRGGLMFLVDDPSPDSICVPELRSLLNDVVQAQNQGNTNTRESVNEIKSKLDTLEVKMGEVQAKLPQEVYAKLEGRLQGVEAKLEVQLQEVQTKLEAKLEESLHEVQTKLEGQLQGVENKLEGHFQEVQTKLGAKLEESLHEVKTKLEGQLQGVENKLEGHIQEVQTKVEAKLEKSLHEVKTKLEGQLQGVENKLEGHLREVQTKLEAKLDESLIAVKKMIETQLKVGVPASATINPPSGFELIGTRYFRIVKEHAIWKTAERRCREMGGYLASFRNEEEFNAITPKLEQYRGYWLGINDRDNEGHFVSVASLKPAPFLKWQKEYPKDREHDMNYVILYDGTMTDHHGNYEFYFICQADNET